MFANLSILSAASLAALFVSLSLFPLFLAWRLLSKEIDRDDDDGLKIRWKTFLSNGISYFL